MQRIRFLPAILLCFCLMITACSQNTCPMANDGRQDPPDYEQDDSYEELDGYPYR